MATRPFTDITKAISANNIKNGTMVVTCARTGFPDAGTIVYERYVLNTPILSDIDDKYGYRFYNGIFINSVNGGNA